ncbi:MAG: TonB family protein [Pseudomonadota bacterium]
MRRLSEAIVFGLLALVVHIALFVVRPSGDVTAGGVGGEAIASIQGANETVVEMVETWETQQPPVTSTDIQIEQPVSVELAPPSPVMNLIQAPNADLQVARVVPPDREALEIRIEELNRQTALSQPQLEARRPQAPGMQTAPDLSSPDRAQPERLQPQMAALPAPQIEPRPDPVDVDTSPAEPTVSKAAPITSPRPEARPESSPEPQPETPTRQARQQEPVPENVPRAEQKSESRAASQAAGSGGSSQAGSGNARSATISQGEINNLKGIWGAKIRSKIERAKRYPRGENANGKVSLNLQVSRTGQLLNVSVRRSSGNARLDAAAINSVKRARRFASAPKGLTDQAYAFSITIELKR